MLAARSERGRVVVVSLVALVGTRALPCPGRLSPVPTNVKSHVITHIFGGGDVLTFL
jgi:hypothetical protein